MRSSLLVLLLVVSVAPAGVYSPDDPCPFQVKPDGTAEQLPLPVFVGMLVDRMAPRVPNLPTAPGIPDWAFSDDGKVAESTYTARLGQLLAARWPQAERSQLRGDDLASHTAALLRFNDTRSAERYLSDRSALGRSYRLKSNRAHAVATAGRWADAGNYLPDIDEEDPTPPAGTVLAQYKWQQAIDQTVYRRWLSLHAADAERSRAPDRDPAATPFALFVTADGKPIRYWESADEAKKLPTDAVAVVQQLLLWAPWDDRLLWTGAEVYSATGKVREAHRLYKMLVSPAETNEGRGFQGPRLLGPMVKRVGEAFDKLPSEEDTPLIEPDSPPPPPAGPDRSGLVFGRIDPVAFYVTLSVFAVVAAVLLALQFRAVVRWFTRPR